MNTVNKYIGSSFDSFLKEEGLLEETHARARKRALAEQPQDSMAERMATSRSQLDRARAQTLPMLV
jgi:antitoxin HicB